MYHRNICRKVREFSNHRHLEDAISVDRIVAELRQESPSPILLYKPQGILDPEIPRKRIVSACYHDCLSSVTVQHFLA